MYECGHGRHCVLAFAQTLQPPPLGSLVHHAHTPTLLSGPLLAGLCEPPEPQQQQQQHGAEVATHHPNAASPTTAAGAASPAAGSAPPGSTAEGAVGSDKATGSDAGAGAAGSAWLPEAQAASVKAILAGGLTEGKRQRGLAASAQGGAPLLPHWEAPTGVALQVCAAVRCCCAV